MKKENKAKAIAILKYKMELCSMEYDIDITDEMVMSLVKKCKSWSAANTYLNELRFVQNYSNSNLEYYEGFSTVNLKNGENPVDED